MYGYCFLQWSTCKYFIEAMCAISQPCINVYMFLTSLSNLHTWSGRTTPGIEIAPVG